MKGGLPLALGRASRALRYGGPPARWQLGKPRIKRDATSRGPRAALLAVSLAVVFPGCAAAGGPLSSFGASGVGVVSRMFLLSFRLGRMVISTLRTLERTASRVFAGHGAFLRTFGEGSCPSRRTSRWATTAGFTSLTHFLCCSVRLICAPTEQNRCPSGSSVQSGDLRPASRADRGATRAPGWASLPDRGREHLAGHLARGSAPLDRDRGQHARPQAGRAAARRGPSGRQQGAERVPRGPRLRNGRRLGLRARRSNQANGPKASSSRSPKCATSTRWR